MFEQILVPLDGSTLSDGILQPLSRLVASQGGGTLHLQQVVEGAASTGRQTDAASNRVRAHLTAIKAGLQREGVSANIIVDRGSAAERILSRVGMMRTDLVAMATHGRSGVSRLVHGSVAEAVLRHCSVPLLLVNPHGLSVVPEKTPFRHLLVPLDGSPEADEILPLVEQIAPTLDAEVVLQFVKESWGVGTARHAAAREQVALALKDQRRRLEEAGLRVSVRADFGPPAAQILEAAQGLHSDLVAMTTHGREGVFRLRFGSVAETVLRNSPCPVLLHRADPSAS